MVVFDETRTLGASGGTVASELYAVSVAFGEGALLSETPVTLTVYNEQFPEIGRDGYQHSANGVHLTLDPRALAPGAAVTVQLGHLGTYDDFGTMLAVGRDDGAFVALPSEPSSPGKVSGVLRQSALDLLFPASPPGERQTLTVFTANRVPASALEAEPLVTSVRAFQDGAFAGQVPDLTNRRVAVVVHGIESSLADLTSLGQFLIDFKQAAQPTNLYDAVIGFEYSSNAELAEIGAALADGMGAAGLAGARSVDLFAHSMGNLVSRYAMETTGLPNRIANVGHYVSLGGPHAGVPFGNLTYLEQAFFYLFNLSATPCLRDLLTDGENGRPQTSFLKDLNLVDGQRGPNFLTAQYFTMSGDDYSGEEPPVGDTVHLLYLDSIGLDRGEQDDGLVAQYSAQNTLLGRQSEAWTPNAPLNLTHTELHTAPEAFATLTAWMNNWQ